jgi:hypothetical protein
MCAVMEGLMSSPSRLCVKCSRDSALLSVGQEFTAADVSRPREPTFGEQLERCEGLEDPRQNNDRV